MASNGHLERAGEAPFARAQAAGWDTRWAPAGPTTSCMCLLVDLHQLGPPEPQRPYTWALGTRRISGPPGIPGGGGGGAATRG
jgi:hypothetical protein